MLQMVVLMIIATLRGKILERINDREKLLCFDTHTKQAILSIIEECCEETAIEEIKAIDDIIKEGDSK